ncbi:hypothetical protein EYF80_012766 [Liparis tanakae]|uniref:Uncharacterized protein n=1 Tax=Liparis tanakae TaxID=230148 RepID=A0A4Z2IG59_9TELE|nr:hypothetical protein EYF80_012766 [Liparis tanakae]
MSGSEVDGRAALIHFHRTGHVDTWELPSRTGADGVHASLRTRRFSAFSTIREQCVLSAGAPSPAEPVKAACRVDSPFTLTGPAQISLHRITAKPTECSQWKNVLKVWLRNH